MYPSKPAGLLKNVTCEQEREIAIGLRHAFAELYDSISILKDDAERLDVELGWILRGHRGRQFSTI